MFSVASRERPPETYVPVIGHASRHALLLDGGGLLTVLRLAGLPFELGDPAEANGRLDHLNVVWRNLADARLTLYAHVVRGLDDGADYPEAPCHSAFARELDQRYRARLGEQRLFRNDLYLSALWRGAPASAADWRSALPFRRRGAPAPRRPGAADLERLEAIVATLVQELRAYRPRVLGLREAGGRLFSEPGEALRRILFGDSLPVPLVAGCLGGAIYRRSGADDPVPEGFVNGRLGGAIYTDRVIVRRRTVEIETAGGRAWAAAFGFREYPARTWPGLLDAVLAAPYRGILTQSFEFLGKSEAHAKLTRKQNQMGTAGDKARSQTEALSEAADALASNAFVLGTHHLSFVVLADTPARLDDAAAAARRDLAESGAVVVREDLALEAAFWGQLPGNLALRLRPGAITSRNFVALAPFHNYPRGARRGHWGQPVTLLRTTGGTAYRCHWHAPTETVQDLGNVFVAGPSGSGKTTLLLFLLAMASRQGCHVVFVDKDRGGEIAARALGGRYLVLPTGAPTGLAPLKALSDTPRDRAFLLRLVQALVGALTPEDERRLALGIEALMDLPPEARGFGELRAFLSQADAEGPGAKLERWCRGGSLGWVLDNEVDAISLEAPFLGFDVTAFLDDAVTRGPILSYLFHRIQGLLDGRRLILAIDEFWKALLDPGFRDLVQDQLKTIRKQNGLLVLATQSPADALASPIAHSILEQCPTQVLFPNARAAAEDYRDGLKLTEAEFRAVRQDLTAGGWRFLLKQGTASVACSLDLSGMEDLIAVLSGRAASVRLMERLIDEFGPEPEAWLPRFRHRWRAATAGGAGIGQEGGREDA